MCGRYTLVRIVRVREVLPGIELDEGEWEARYNIAPTQEVAVTVSAEVAEGRGGGAGGRGGEAGRLRVEKFRWGLIPFWAKEAEIGNRMINARAESVAEKAAFRKPLERRRCLIWADGFYEWQKVGGEGEGTEGETRNAKRETRNEGVRNEGMRSAKSEMRNGGESVGSAGGGRGADEDGGATENGETWRKRRVVKIPMYIRMKDGMPFAFAGLWETWKSPTGEEVRSCAIITTGPNELMRPIHDRMPAILPREKLLGWLEPRDRTAEEMVKFLGPYPAEEMEAWEVGRAVNSPGNEGEELVRRVGGEMGKQKLESRKRKGEEPGLFG